MNKSGNLVRWNRVTPLSKYLAMFLFVALPFIGFWLGIKYQQNIDLAEDGSEKSQYFGQATVPANSQHIMRGELNTYTSADYGYQLKYPSEWIVIREGESSTLIAWPEVADNGYVEDGEILILVWDIGDKTLDEFMNQENPTTGGLYRETYKAQKMIKIDGRPGLVTFGGCCGLWGHSVFVKNGNFLYQFAIRESAGPGGELEEKPIEDFPVFKKIVDSIKFVGQSSL